MQADMNTLHKKPTKNDSTTPLYEKKDIHIDPKVGVPVSLMIKNMR